MPDPTPTTPADETDDTGSPSTVLTGPDHAVAKSAVDTILDLDTILSSARLMERTSEICLDGAVENELRAVIAELGNLVDADGNPLDEDEGLNEVSRARELQAKAQELTKQRDARTIRVRFRALPTDEWETFDKSHRTGSDKHLKDQRAWENALILTCAVHVEANGETEPLTAAHLAKFRKAFNQAQFVKLYNDAYIVNMADGIDVPKSPSFLHAPRPQE